MSDLFGSITSNLAYEFLGVFLPGMIVSVFLLLFWIALGPATPHWTFGVLPEFSMASLDAGLNSLSPISGASIVIPLFAIRYFAGHLLLWLGRNATSREQEHERWAQQIWRCITFRIPQPTETFDPELKDLFDSVKSEFAAGEIELGWRQFYPVAKSYLAQHLRRSLVVVYQNKYTLHRSIVAASILLFWLSLIAFALSIFLPFWFEIPVAEKLPMALLLAGFLALIWAFSSSYAYHWRMFGNTIVTELYGLLRGPTVHSLNQTRSSEVEPNAQ
ncbi:MAG: hypothetical protein U5O39_10560 [Gammaproteobacteria bacterium]|nr:hypothetical protein [Gammaproteobacteria bacterium]